MAYCLARAHACGIEPSRPPAEHSRSHPWTRRSSSARTSGSCSAAAVSTCCDAIRAGLPPPPVLRCASNPCRVAPTPTSAWVKEVRRVWPHRGSSELVAPGRRLRFAASPSSSPRQNRPSTSARTEARLHWGLPSAAAGARPPLRAASLPPRRVRPELPRLSSLHARTPARCRRSLGKGILWCRSRSPARKKALGAAAVRSGGRGPGHRRLRPGSAHPTPRSALPVPGSTPAPPARRRRLDAGPPQLLHARASCGTTLSRSSTRTARLMPRRGKDRRRQGGSPLEEAPPVEEEEERQREEKQRRRNRISQGLMRKFRKLQGPLGKVKFHINLKP
jgi:hypothetical protein